MSFFTLSVAAAKAKRDNGKLSSLSATWNAEKAKATTPKKLTIFNLAYGSVDPIAYVTSAAPAPVSTPAAPTTTNTGTGSGGVDPGATPAPSSPAPGTTAEAPSLTPSPAASAGSTTTADPFRPGPPQLPAAGTPAQAGEYYSDTAAVWAGGDVTRRACEIMQPGARGACKKFGFPWGIAVPAPVTSAPAATPMTPYDNSVPGAGSGLPAFGYDEVDPTATSYVDGAYAPANADELDAGAPVQDASRSSPPMSTGLKVGLAIGAAALLFGGAKKARARRR